MLLFYLFSCCPPIFPKNHRRANHPQRFFDPFCFVFCSPMSYSDTINPTFQPTQPPGTGYRYDHPTRTHCHQFRNLDTFSETQMTFGT